MSLEAFALRLGLGTVFERNEEKSLLLDSNDDEELSCSYSGIRLKYGDTGDAGVGLLYVTTRRIVWCAGEDRTDGLVLRYPQVVVHAISHKADDTSEPSIYLQLDDGEDLMADEEDEDDEGEGWEEHGSELWLVPESSSTLEGLFNALNECAALNPDTEVEEEGQAEFYFNEEEVLAGLSPSERAALLATRCQDQLDLENGGHDDLDDLVAGDPGRFEDMEEGEEEGEEEEEKAA